MDIKKIEAAKAQRASEEAQIVNEINHANNQVNELRGYIQQKTNELIAVRGAQQQLQALTEPEATGVPVPEGAPIEKSPIKLVKKK